MYVQLTEEKIPTDAFNITFIDRIFFTHNKQPPQNVKYSWYLLLESCLNTLLKRYNRVSK